MNKRALAILILCIGVIVVVVAYMLRPQAQRLAVLSTSPENHGSQNPYLPLTVTFNRELKEGEVAVIIIPDTQSTSAIRGDTITITPKTIFSPETQYSVSVSTSPQYAFDFTTQTDIENYPGMNEAIQKDNAQYRQQSATQDAALANIRTHAPIQNDGFTVRYSYTNNTYTVTLIPPYDKNRAAFLSWLTQSGVTNTTDVRLNYVNR